MTQHVGAGSAWAGVVGYSRAVRVGDTVHVAGTTAIREGSRLERAFRDVYSGTQHAFISEKVAIDAAQIWLGVIEDQFGL